MSIIAMQGGLMAANTGGGSVDPFVAASHPTAQTGSTISVSVPVGAAVGDTLVMVVRVRGDRSVTAAPGGFSTTIDQSIGSGISTQTQRVYVFTKAYAGETTVSCTQSTSAAHGVSLYVVRGSIVNSTIGQVTSNTQDITITKVSASNGLLALGLVISGGGFTTANPTQSDWTQRGTDYYSNSDYFGVGYSRAHNGSSASAHIGAGISLGGSGNPNAVVIVEVQP